ncbi:hypothetical protein GCM10023187_12040 [Nibrella viscosa]|uniref:Uncharacterized protein n=2 Tax=Nibrella viscosa TaxID=1084524 RepID=A0ABP8K3U3_9BACT
MSANTGAYTIQFISAAPTVDQLGTIFTYTIAENPQSQGSKGQLIFDLGCAKFSDLTSVLIGDEEAVKNNTKDNAGGCSNQQALVNFVRLPGVAGFVPNDGSAVTVQFVFAALPGLMPANGNVYNSAGANCTPTCLAIPAGCGTSMGCSYSQGFYFSSPVGKAASASKYLLAVPSSSTFTYSQAQAITIFNGRSGGSANLSNMFTQLATIYLSQQLGYLTIDPSSDLAGYVQTLEAFLTAYGKKLDGTKLETNKQLKASYGGVSTAAAVAAANGISAWINDCPNHCGKDPFMPPACGE